MARASFVVGGAGDCLWDVCNGFETLRSCMLGGVEGTGERWEREKREIREWKGGQVMLLRCSVLQGAIGDQGFL